MKPYFEGWYFKHQNKSNTIAFIPSFHVEADGEKSAMLQVITNDGAYSLSYPPAVCHVDRKRSRVQIGSNYFSKKGIQIRLNRKGLVINGNLRYSSFQPLRYDIMGPFRLIPNMQCNHGVLSLTHSLQGTLNIDGKTIDFTGGSGYIEKDWGSSFPKSYLWTQCNWQDTHKNCVMVSSADIPFAGRRFAGCICAIYYHGLEYRLATYCGVKILRCSKNELLLHQGSCSLHVSLLETNPHPLKAPVQGGMKRIIHESPSCTVRYQFRINNRILFDITSTQAGFEYSSMSAD